MIDATVAGLRSARRVRPSALMNGAGASVGVAIIALLAHELMPAFAPGLMLGAICASVADTPSPLREKLKRIGLGWILSTFAVLAARASDGLLWSGLFVVAMIGFVAAMVTAYGRNVIPVTVSILLALVLSESAVQMGGASPIATALWFSLGGICYMAYAALATPLQMRWTRSMLVQEALKALVGYLRAQYRALTSDAPPASVYAMLVDAQAILAERIQAARNVVFVGMRTDEDRQIAAQLLVAIDILEASLSTQADLDALRDWRDTQDSHQQALRGLLLVAISDLERLARGVSDAMWQEGQSIGDRQELLARLTAMPRQSESPRQAVLHATADKLDVLFSHIDRLHEAQGNASIGAEVVRGIDLKPFVQRSHFDLTTLRREFHLHSPILRYGVRLSLAMSCGYLVGRLLPEGAHGSWILLTVALVMRASYSVTRQRRYERLMGNVIGCVIAGVTLWLAPSWLISIAVFVTVGMAHAFAAQSYLIASVASCIMALLQIRVPGSEEGVFVLMRIVDTAIGGLIAYAFSHFLPHWEAQSIRRLEADLHRAEAECARSALGLHTSDQDYRLARRRIFDAISALSAAVTRMLDEPGASGAEARRLSEVLAIAYVFAAELASVRVFLRSRADLDDDELAAALDHARHTVEARLADVSGQPVAISATVRIDSLDPETYEGAGRIARRLRRLIQVAERIAGAQSPMKDAERTS